MNRMIPSVLISATLGLASMASAAPVIYDHFDGDTLDTALWQGVSGTVTVGASQVTLGDENGWTGMSSTQDFGDASAEASYIFKVTGITTDESTNQVFGLRDTNTSRHVEIAKSYSYYTALFIDGNLVSDYFVMTNNSEIELRRTADNWQVYQNGSLVAESGSGVIGSFQDYDGAAVRLSLAYGPGNPATVAYDYVAIEAIPEPGMLSLAGAGAVVLMRRRRGAN